MGPIARGVSEKNRLAMRTLADVLPDAQLLCFVFVL